MFRRFGIIILTLLSLFMFFRPTPAQADDKTWEPVVNQHWEPSYVQQQWEPSYAKQHTVRLHRATVKMDRRDRAITGVNQLSRGRLFVKFNNGSRWIFAPCKVEDSERCWWQAEVRGNREGLAFVRVWGRTFYEY